MNKIIPAVLMLAVLGAGCPSTMTYKGANGSKPPAAKLGFGKLPSLQAYGALGTSEAMSSSYMGRGVLSISPTPAAAPMAVGTVALDAKVAEESAGNVVVTNVGGGTVGSMGMRIAPMPPEDYKPVPAKYTVSASLPDWSGEGDVLHVKRPQPDSSVVRSVASGAGLPGQLINGIQTVQSISASWRDAQGFTWNIDPVNGNLNWWKEIDWRVATPPARPETAPKVDKARLIAAADAFLDAHGLSSIKAQGGEVDNSPYVSVLFDPAAASSMPCIMKEEAVVRDVNAAEDEKMATSLIYPSPCGGYWPQQVSVFYGSNREGLPVVDGGGWPNRATSISVDVTTYEVMGGNVLFTEQTERSAYPLISKDEAMKRLQAGGRNIMYTWDGGEITVEISEVKLAWMRHDTWTEGRQETYFLPALSAKGTSTYKGQPAQEYYTVVPLVADSAFDLDPNTGYPMPLMMEAGTATPPPATDPIKR